MATALEGDGYHVLDARTGREALTLFDEGGLAIDLLLTDMKMPGMGEPERIERLRGRRRTLKVWAFSAYSLHVPKGVTFITTPFSRDALVTAVSEALADG